MKYNLVQQENSLKFSQLFPTCYTLNPRKRPPKDFYEKVDGEQLMTWPEKKIPSVDFFFFALICVTGATAQGSNLLIKRRLNIDTLLAQPSGPIQDSVSSPKTH